MVVVSAFVPPVFCCGRVGLLLQACVRDLCSSKSFLSNDAPYVPGYVRTGINTGPCITGDADCDGNPGAAGALLTSVSAAARDEVVLDLSEYLMIVVDFGVDNIQATIPANDFWLNPNYVREARARHVLAFAHTHSYPHPRPDCLSLQYRCVHGRVHVCVRV